MRRFNIVTVFLLLAAVALTGFAAENRPAAKVDVLEFSSRILKNNPLNDPVTRRIAVFVPDQATNGTALPVVYYLPGFGGSSDGVLKKPEAWLAITDKIARETTPVLIVIPDGRDHWGCSQYVNSPAQGNYADYICDEVVPFVEARYHLAVGISNRIVAGHSSGGFGALRLGMMKPKLFGGVVAMSPDSDFNVSHLPLVQIASVTNAALKDIQSFMHQKAGDSLPKDGDLIYALALSSAYAPRGWTHPGQFDWICDGSGRVREDVWKKWVANDPLTLASDKRTTFRSWQKIYVEGAAQDDYKANIGARKIYRALQEAHVPCAFYEPPGKHSAHTLDRLQRGLAWLFNRPLTEITQR